APAPPSGRSDRCHRRAETARSAGSACWARFVPRHRRRRRMRAAARAEERVAASLAVSSNMLPQRGKPSPALVWQVTSRAASELLRDDAAFRVLVHAVAIAIAADGRVVVLAPALRLHDLAARQAEERDGRCEIFQ